MSNYFELITEVLNEKGLTISDLEKNKILKQNEIYKYKVYYPSLKNIINIANFLRVSIDFIAENTSKNNFKQYKPHQNNFHKILMDLIKSYGLTQRKFCKETGCSLGTISKWKKGSIPKFSTLVEISNTLNCRIDDLLETE